MSWDNSTAASGGYYGAQTGYNIGSNFGPWGAAIGGTVGLIGGALGGGFGFGGKAGMPNASPLVGMGESEWQWYKQNVIPMQRQGMQNTFGPQAYSKAVNAATSDVQAAYDRAGSEFQRRTAGMGGRPNEAQSAAFNKSAALSKGLYMAGAQNVARQNVASQQAAMTGA